MRILTSISFLLIFFLLSNAYAQEGQLLWSYDADETNTTASIEHDGTIYIGSDDDSLYAINPNGTLKWKYATGGNIESSPVVGKDDSIYFVSADDNLYALTNEGARKWVYRLPCGFNSASKNGIALNDDGSIIVVSGGLLLKISEESQLIWSTDLSITVETEDGEIITRFFNPKAGPIIDVSGIYIAGSSFIVAYNQEGERQWYHDDQSMYVSYNSMTLTEGNNLLLGASDNNLYSYSNSGEFLWQFTSGGRIESSPVTGPDGTIYFGSGDNKLYAIDQDGYYLWEYLVDNDIECSPVIGADSVIYFTVHGSTEEGVYALNPDGSFRWNYRFEGNSYGSPSLTNDGTLIVPLGYVSYSSMHGNILALETSSSGLATSVWPTLGHDNAHTSNVPYLTPLNDTTTFVQQVYQDFLGRDADAGGLAYWVDAIDIQGVPRAQLVEGFLNSAEFGQTVSPVTRLYFAYFNRIPDYSGLMYWIDNYAQETPLATISDAFAGSAEFIATYGSLDNSAFVTLVYQNVLGRDPDASGLSYWIGQLDTSAVTRGELMIGFSESTEYIALMENQIYVTMTYIGLLRRSPDQGGFDYWVGVMDGGGSSLALIEGFLSSGEYAAWF